MKLILSFLIIVLSLNSNNAQNHIFATPNNQYRVVAVKTVQNTTPIISESNIVESKQPFSVYAPNAFSPDNDGVNDFFFVSVQNISSFELKIFDRWGNEVFYTTDPKEHWNGSFKGTEAPIGGYVYQVSCTGENYNEVFNYSGTLALVR